MEESRNNERSKDNLNTLIKILVINNKSRNYDSGCDGNGNGSNNGNKDEDRE